MKKHRRVPQCGAKRVVRVPDRAMRYSSGNNIYTSTVTLAGKIPVIRYVLRLRLCGELGRAARRTGRDRAPFRLSAPL